ncbi:MAG: glycosyltransferase family 39 protein [Planctomycetota bacterium]
MSACSASTARAASRAEPRARARRVGSGRRRRPAIQPPSQEPGQEPAQEPAQEPDQPSPRSARLRLALSGAALLLALYLPGLASGRPLAEPDELRYAELAREMRLGGDWVSPRLDGLPYLEKPPLHTWLGAAAQGLCGAAPWTARLVPTAEALLSVLAAAALAGVWWGPRAAGLAALVHATGLAGLALAQFDVVDTTLACCLDWGMVLLALALERARAARWLLPGAGALLGLAVLAKGPIGVVLPTLAMLVHAAWSRRWSLLRPAALLGLLTTATVALPWLWAAQRAHPGGEDQPSFLAWFLVHEHAQRFLTATHDRGAPALVLALALLVGALPWTPALVAALAELRGRARGLLALGGASLTLIVLLELLGAGLVRLGLSPPGLPVLGLLLFLGGALRAALRPGSVPVPGPAPPEDEPEVSRELLLMAWVLAPLVFFAASHSKLVTYVLPCFLPLSLLVARWWGQLLEAGAPAPLAVRRGLAALTTLAGPGVALAGWALSRLEALRGSLLPWVLTGALLTLAGAGVAWAGRRGARALLGAVVLWTALLASGGSALAARVVPRRSANELASLLSQVAAPEDALLVASYRQAFPYALRRPIRLLVRTLDSPEGAEHEGLLGGPLRADDGAQVWLEAHALSEDLRGPLLLTPPAERLAHLVERRRLPALWRGPRRVWLALPWPEPASPDDPTWAPGVWWVAREGKLLLVTNHPHPRARRLARWEEVGHGPFRAAVE